jgi:dihydrofolate reductase
MAIKTIIPALSIIIPEDMAHFKETTKGAVCIMGRKTYEDMYEMVMSKRKSKDNPKEILPGRESFVVTSDTKYIAIGATPVQSIREAVQSLDETDHREIFVLGGEKMFIEALSWTRTIYLTIVKGERFQCDKFFPIEALNKHYKIVDGKETDKLYFVTYKRG